MPIRPLDGEAKGHAAAVGEDAPFGAMLPAVDPHGELENVLEGFPVECTTISA
jgi:hypothetical protein